MVCYSPILDWINHLHHWIITHLDADHTGTSAQKMKKAQKFLIPKGGVFNLFKVSSANYFGELLEWIGWAIMTLSWPGLIFALWTFANLGPRAHTLRNWYIKTFGEEFTKLKRKRMIPYIF